MATHNARHGQYVPVLAENESSTVYAPTAPADGQWFGVKNMSRGSAAYTITVDGNGNQIEPPFGHGLAATTELAYALECVVWQFIEGAWRCTGGHNPRVDAERFQYTGADLLVTGWTDVPLTFDPMFDPAQFYFTVEAGNLRCAARFQGFINMAGYFNLLLPANNTDALILMELELLEGVATWRQGHGLAASAGSSRAADQFFGFGLRVPAVVEVGALINLRATDDAGQTGMSYVLNETALMFENI